MSTKAFSEYHLIWRVVGLLSGLFEKWLECKMNSMSEGIAVMSLRLLSGLRRRYLLHCVQILCETREKVCVGEVEIGHGD